MARRSIAFLLVLALTAILVAGCGSTTTPSAQTTAAAAASASAGKTPNVVMALVAAAVPRDLQLVQDKLNESLSKKVGVTATLQYFTWADFTDKTNMIIASSGQQLDIMPIINDWSTYTSQGKLLDLTDVYNKYGTDIQACLGDKFLQAGIVNGKVLGIRQQMETAKEQIDMAVDC